MNSIRMKGPYGEIKITIGQKLAGKAYSDGSRKDDNPTLGEMVDQCVYAYNALKESDDE